MAAQRSDSTWFLPVHFPNQPRLGQTPVAIYALRRYVKDRCDFVGGETSEVAHLDDLGLAGIESGQFLQRVVQPDYQRIGFRRKQQLLVECRAVNCSFTFGTIPGSGI